MLRISRTIRFKIIHWLTCGILALGTWPLASALDPARTLNQYRHKDWNATNGLLYPSVRSIHQTSDGYLWLSTRGGLARFDGITFTSFTRENVPEMVSDEISGVIEDPDRRMLVATSKGFVSRWQNHWSRPTGGLEAFAEKEIRWLARDGTSILFGTENTLYRKAGNQITPLALSPEVKFRDLRGVVYHSPDEMMILAEPAWLIRGTLATPITNAQGRAINEIFSAARDSTGGWWIGHPRGLQYLKDGHAQNFDQLDQQTVKAIRSLHFDREGALWIGTRNELLRYHQGKLQTLDLPGVDSFANFLCFYDDYEGNLWGGTGSGIVRLSDAKVTTFTKQNGLPVLSTLSVLASHDQSLWIAAQGGGLVQKTATGLKVFRTADGLADDSINNLAEAPDGAIWLGYYGRGVGRFFAGQFTHYNKGPALDARFRDLKVDRDGTVWVLTLFKGLMRLEKDTFVIFPLASMTNPTSALPDSAGGLWLAGPEGLGLLDPATGQWRRYFPEPKDRQRIAVAIVRDLRDDLWIIRDGCLIQRLRHGTDQLEDYQLPTTVGILSYGGIVHRDSLWVSMRSGVICIPLAEFDAVQAGTKPAVEYEIYNEVDGMLSPAPNISNGQNLCLAADGSLNFATSNGVAIIQPDHIRKFTTPPLVVIDHVLIDKVPYHPAEMTGLKPLQNEVAFSYNAFGLSDATQVRFKYRLVGVDSDWVDAGSRREAFYGGLRPGDYRFEVRAGNEDGVWNNTGATCAFRLPPRAHQTWWFRILVILLIPALVWLLIRRNSAVLRREKEALERGIEERTHDLLEAKNQADKASRAKSDFLAVMSHEIRTPLSGVIGMLQLLQKQAKDPSQRSHTETARESAESLLLILNDVLDIAKIESGKLTLEQAPFSPRDLFLKTTELMRTRAEARGIALECTISPTVPAVLIGDSTRLRQITNNLLGNAIKFTERGGVYMEVLAESAGDNLSHLCVKVRDTGIGISPEAQERIFHKFEQADNSTTRNFGGTGLGLSIVRSIAELMDGVVSIDSTLGEGSTFTFTGIMAIGQESALTANADNLGLAPSLTASRPLHLLCAEDNSTNRTIIRELVIGMGHTVEFAVNGREAVGRLKSEHFDAVLMDTRMPVMDGLQAIRLVRDPASGALDPKITIISVSANAAKSSQQECFDAGSTEFLEKPIDEKKLFAALERSAATITGPLPPPKISPTPATPPAVSPPSTTGPTPPAALSADEIIAALDAAPSSAVSPAARLSPAAREEIRQQFLLEAPELIRAMRASLATATAEELGRAAHTLKSMSRYVDATPLSETCAQIEALADDNQFTTITPLLATAEDELATVLGRLQPQEVTTVSS